MPLFQNDWNKNLYELFMNYACDTDIWNMDRKHVIETLIIEKSG